MMHREGSNLAQSTTAFDAARAVRIRQDGVDGPIDAPAHREYGYALETYGEQEHLNWYAPAFATAYLADQRESVAAVAEAGESAAPPGDRTDHSERSLGMAPRSMKQRATDAAGIRALMLAVLEDGIRSYCAGTGRAREEAERWIWTHDRTSPFSFAVVCEVLGLDPSAVRKALGRLQPGGRVRPNAGPGRHAVRPGRRRPCRQK